MNNNNFNNLNNNKKPDQQQQQQLLQQQQQQQQQQQAFPYYNNYMPYAIPNSYYMPYPYYNYQQYLQAYNNQVQQNPQYQNTSFINDKPSINQLGLPQQSYQNNMNFTKQKKIIQQNPQNNELNKKNYNNSNKPYANKNYNQHNNKANKQHFINKNSKAVIVKPEKQIKYNPQLDNPEEIKKWIAARKRNYPTKEKILNKQKLQNQKESEGQPTNNDLSKLELKLRKQMHFMCGTKSLQIKMKSMQVLRGMITDPTPRTKLIKKSRQINKRNIKITPQEEVNSDHQPQEKPIERYIQKQVGAQKVTGLIQSLKQKREDEKKTIETIFQYKSNSANYKHVKNTLEANMLLQDIFKENCYILQSLRFIVKSNFLEKQEEEVVIEQQSPSISQRDSALEQGQIGEQQQSQIISRQSGQLQE